MFVEFEPIDDPERNPERDLERELRLSLQRRPAPADLKRKVMQKHRERASQTHQRVMWFERLAASLVLGGVISGAVFWHNAQERRRGEEVKQQVFTALRITNHALAVMNAQLQQRQANE
jgi:hypothetical protein